MHANEQDRAANGKGQQPGRAQTRARAAGGGMPAGLLALQAGAGNAAVVQMLRQAGHPWAQPGQHQHGAGCGHQQTEQPAVQRSAVHDVLRAPGRALDDATRTDMESRLGADFSDVRIHNDSAAKASAAEVGARAYTSGSHVVIGDGGGDKHTLAHELTHVIQQRQGPVAGADNGAGLKVSDPSDRYEREAEANARRVMSGTGSDRSAHRDTAGSASGTRTDTVQRLTVPGLGTNAVVGIGRDYSANSTATAFRPGESEMLTDGSLGGTGTGVTSPAGWHYIQAVGQSGNWIRFHLVNEEAGGLGVVENLVSSSARDNSQYHTLFERALKRDVNAARRLNTPGAPHLFVYFGVEVAYSGSRTGSSQRYRDASEEFPTHLRVHHWCLDSTTGAGWQPVQANAVFQFQDSQPLDTAQPAALSRMDIDVLKQYTSFTPANRAWNDDDLAFLKRLGTANTAEYANFSDMLGVRNLNIGGIVNQNASSIQGALADTGYTSTRVGNRPGRQAAPTSTTRLGERLDATQIANLARSLSNGSLHF
ncbi:DUF4157 domain-containing protein [Streptomyces sp. NPDC050516]|uniref:DUF4157 domain-containing protein n=1 Tax=Streptomyces sp. NPDC050516 TaxID=3365621 RepID=UPI00379F7322